MRLWLRLLGILMIASALGLDVAWLVTGAQTDLPSPLQDMAEGVVLLWDRISPQAAAESDDVVAEVGLEAEQQASPGEPANKAESTSTPPAGQDASTPLPRLTASATATPSPPARIIIKAIGLDAPVVPVSVTPDGAMGTPRTAHEVGWYGPVPGEPGNALLAGHVDWVENGKVRAGSFYLLRRLEAGDEIVMQTASGERRRFAVVWRRYFEAATAPVAAITDPTSEPSLTLITCGGPFDRTLKSYLGRWVVRAVRVG